MKKYYEGRLFPGVMELRTRAVELWVTKKPPVKPGNTLTTKVKFMEAYTSSSGDSDYEVDGVKIKKSKKKKKNKKKHKAKKKTKAIKTEKPNVEKIGVKKHLKTESDASTMYPDSTASKTTMKYESDVSSLTTHTTAKKNSRFMLL